MSNATHVRLHHSCSSKRYTSEQIHLHVSQSTEKYYLKDWRNEPADLESRDQVWYLNIEPIQTR